MKNGYLRFEFYLTKLQEHLDKAGKQKNPALYLYTNGARTPVFMLEGLCKLYAGLHNKNKFSKLKEHFKLLEDVLGAIDYYDGFAKEFVLQKNIPAVITKYLQALKREKLEHLNEILIEKDWLGKPGKRINKIKEKLGEADWQKPEEEVTNINRFYIKSIESINSFVKETGTHFDNVESDVHELRRKMRWLSIYPQALRGCIQLSKKNAPPRLLTKYLTKEIINSPFNKMPDAGDNRHFLLLEQNYFYALSWMIAEMGKLKDAGLRVIAIREALQNNASLNEADALKKAYQICGKKQPNLASILADAEKICKLYFKENNLQHLIIGNSQVV